MSNPPMILALCECGKRFWRESNSQQRHCTECTEKRPGLPPRSSRTAHTNSHEKEAAMDKSTTHTGGPLEVTSTKYGDMVSHEPVNEALNTLLVAATGRELYELQWYLRNSTSLSSEEAWDRLGRGHDWTIGDIVEISALWKIKASDLTRAVLEVSEGFDARDVVQRFGLDRRPCTVPAGAVEERAS